MNNFVKLKILFLALFCASFIVVFKPQAYAQETCEWAGGHHICYSDMGCTPGESCTHAAFCSCFTDDSPDGGYCGRAYVDGHCDGCGGSGDDVNCSFLQYNECADSGGGETGTNCDGGFHVMVYVFEDTNENGKWDDGEEGINLGSGDPRVADPRVRTAVLVYMTSFLIVPTKGMVLQLTVGNVVVTISVCRQQ